MENMGKKKSFQDMTIHAIEALNERKGSSLLAIKKYIDANYHVDGEKSRLYIKKYIQKALTTGELIQATGKGLGGSFKLPKEKKKAGEATSKATKDAKLKKKGKKLKKPKIGEQDKEKSNTVNHTEPKLSAVVEMDPALNNKNLENTNKKHDGRNKKENGGMARKDIETKKKKTNKTETKAKNMKAKKAVLKRASLINVSMGAGVAKMKKRSNRVKANAQTV